MFEISYPWMFLLLPLPWAVMLLIPKAKARPKSALRIPFFTDLQQLPTQSIHKIFTTRFKKLILLLMWVALIVAASQPQWLGAEMPIERKGRDIVMAIDISPSMQIDDMVYRKQRYRRIDIVKSVASNFIKRRKGDRIGLILFATKPYMLTPLTFDHKTVSAQLNDASIGIAGKATGVGTALGLAIKRLRDTPEQSRVIILLTDGADNASQLKPIDAANFAKNFNIRIYTIGIGSNADRFAPSFFGGQRIMNNGLNEKSLKSIADTTGGRYFRATNADELIRIYQLLDQLEPVSQEQASYRPISPLYPWPLAFALLLSLALMPLSAWRFKY